MTVFTVHTVESAPAASRRALSAVEAKQGYLPAAAALMAESPEVLESFLRLSAALDSCTLEPLARETVIMTVAARNQCHVCLAMHSARLAALGAEPSLAAALRAQAPLTDARLQAARAFAVRVMETAGDPGEAALGEFFSYGFTPRNALEVVLGIGAYTLSTLANRLTAAPVDEQLMPFA